MFKGQFWNNGNVIIRHNRDPIGYNEGLSAAVAEIVLLQTAEKTQFGPALHAYGYCDAGKHFWQALEYFDGSLRDYMEKFRNNNATVASHLKSLFSKMAASHLLCVDLKPENVVVQFDKTTGVITKMRLIDFDNVFCLEHVQEDNFVLFLSMLCIYSINSGRQYPNLFKGLLRRAFFDGKQDGFTRLTQVIELLEKTTIGKHNEKLGDFMKAYYNANIGAEEVDRYYIHSGHDWKGSQVRGLVERALSGGGKARLRARSRARARVRKVGKTAHPPGAAAARAARMAEKGGRVPSTRARRQKSPAVRAPPPNRASISKFNAKRRSRRLASKQRGQAVVR